MTDLRVYAKQQSVSRATDDTWKKLRGTRDGAPVVQPWLTALAIEGLVFQVKAGTKSDIAEGDILITDAKAEMCADVLLNRSLIVVHLDATFESLSGGTIPEIAAKSAAGVSTVGDAFVPLNLRLGGPASSATARVDEVGGCTVPVELATTTRRHYSATVAAVASYKIADNVMWAAPPVLVGPACFYVQIAGVTAGPDYFAAFDFVDLATRDVT